MRPYWNMAVDLEELIPLQPPKRRSLFRFSPEKKKLIPPEKKKLIPLQPPKRRSQKTTRLLLSSSAGGLTSTSHNR